MMAMHGFSGWRLGLCTRRVLSGGSRMGLWDPAMMAEGRAGGRFGEGEGEGRRLMLCCRLASSRCRLDMRGFATSRACRPHVLRGHVG